jgi:hypothetical protein
LAKAFASGVKWYAWWKDGTEMVGTCGQTYKEAEAEIRSAAGIKKL